MQELISPVSYMRFTYQVLYGTEYNKLILGTSCWTKSTGHKFQNLWVIFNGGKHAIIFLSLCVYCSLIHCVLMRTTTHRDNTIMHCNIVACSSSQLIEVLNIEWLSEWLALIRDAGGMCCSVLRVVLLFCCCCPY